MSGLMVRTLLMILLLGSSRAMFAQTSQSPSNSPAGPQQKSQPNAIPPSQEPPRSDRGSAASSGAEPDESSSKESEGDISPPANDAKAHPQSSQAMLDAEMSENHGSGGSHPWDPHKAAKDIEVGDFYLKVKKNYHAAEDRYREALYYKENDAMATYGLAVCLEKLNQPDDARQEYEAYLKILPEGPEAKNVRKALTRLKEANPTPNR
jgi:tetratricopeptide (TPR) repeat protein